MQINGPSQLHGAQGLNGPHFRKAAAPAEADGSQGSDQVSFSAEASEASRLIEVADSRAAEHVKDADGVRTGLVSRLKSEIAEGKYESGDKLDAALDRFLEEIG